MHEVEARVDLLCVAEQLEDVVRRVRILTGGHEACVGQHGVELGDVEAVLVCSLEQLHGGLVVTVLERDLALVEAHGGEDLGVLHLLFAGGCVVRRLLLPKGQIVVRLEIHAVDVVQIEEIVLHPLQRDVVEVGLVLHREPERDLVGRLGDGLRRPLLEQVLELGLFLLLVERIELLLLLVQVEAFDEAEPLVLALLLVVQHDDVVLEELEVVVVLEESDLVLKAFLGRQQLHECLGAGHFRAVVTRNAVEVVRMVPQRLGRTGQLAGKRRVLVLGHGVRRVEQRDEFVVGPVRRLQVRRIGPRLRLGLVARERGQAGLDQAVQQGGRRGRHWLRGVLQHLGRGSTSVEAGQKVALLGEEIQAVALAPFRRHRAFFHVRLEQGGGTRVAVGLLDRRDDHAFGTGPQPDREVLLGGAGLELEAPFSPGEDVVELVA
jgi:hypothetical protein